MLYHYLHFVIVHQSSKVSLKGDLKTCHLRHRLRIFLFCRKVMLHSQDIQFFIFLTIAWFTESVTSWWVLVYPQLIYPPNFVNSYSLFTNQTWSIDRYISKGNIFPESFKQFGGMDLATWSNYSMTNYVKFPVFHFFERMNKVELKMVNFNY